MKSPSSEELPSSERFVDAALREQSRLGSHEEDAELINTVFERTIQAEPLPTTSVPLPRSGANDRRLWIASSVAAAALLALLVSVMSSLPYRSGNSPETEMQFTVRFLPVETTSSEPRPKSPPPVAEAQPYRDSVTLPSSFPALPARLKSPDAIVEITTSFGPSLASLPEKPVRREIFRIAADQSDNGPMARHYSGSVRIEHDEFLIEANSADIAAHEGSSQPRIVAHDVVLTQFYPARRVQAAEMAFNAENSSFVLTGVRSLETKAGRLNRFAKDDRISLTSNSLSIESASTSLDSLSRP